MWLILALLFITQVQREIPYKPDNEFSIRLDMKFRVRPSDSPGKIDLSETRAEYERRNSSSQLPFLNLLVMVKESNLGEARMRIMRDGKVVAANRKIEIGKEFKLEVGFTDDAKDKISGYEHVIYFLTADKKDVNRIVVRIEENGDYSINGQKRGRL